MNREDVQKVLLPRSVAHWYVVYDWWNDVLYDV